MVEFLSVGIPAYNEEESIARTLESIFHNTLWRQTPSGHKELIVGCNGCTDRTAKIVKRITADHPKGEIKLVETEKGKARAWNAILSAADPSAEKLYFTDADIVLDRKALENLKGVFGLDKDLIAGKPVALTRAEGKLARLYNQAMAQLWKSGNGLSGRLYAIRKSFAENHRIPLNVINDDAFLEAIVDPKRIGFANNAKVFFQMPKNLHDIMAEQVRVRTGQRQLSEMGIRKEPGIAKKTRIKVSQLNGLSFNEKVGRLLVISIGRIAAVKSKTGYRIRVKKLSEHGWEKVSSEKFRTKGR